MDDSFSKVILEQIWSSRQSSTVQKYCYAIRKYFAFHFLVGERVNLPVSAMDAAKYIAYLRHSSASHSAFKLIIVALKWLNNFYPGINKFNCPLEDNFLLRLRDSALRQIPKKSNQKDPIDGSLINRIIRTLPENPSLTELRNVLMPALAYSLLLRHDELSHLNCLYFFETSEGMKISIPSSKTDVFRQGKTVFLAKTSQEPCIFSLLKRYLTFAGMKTGINHFLFTPVVAGSVINKKLSYDFFLQNIKLNSKLSIL